MGTEVASRKHASLKGGGGGSRNLCIISEGHSVTNSDTP
jgi:hypothetical protein